MQYICVTATRDEIRELSFATKWFADLCFTENDRIYRTTELSLQYYQYVNINDRVMNFNIDVNTVSINIISNKSEWTLSSTKFCNLHFPTRKSLIYNLS